MERMRSNENESWTQQQKKEVRKRIDVTYKARGMKTKRATYCKIFYKNNRK